MFAYDIKTDLPVSTISKDEKSTTMFSQPNIAELDFHKGNKDLLDHEWDHNTWKKKRND